MQQINNHVLSCPKNVPKVWVCVTVCASAGRSWGSKRKHTKQTFCSARPSSSFSPTFTAYIAYLTVVNDVIQTWINRRAKVKGRSKLFFKPCPMSHFLLLKLGHKQTCICIWKSQDDHTRTIPVKRMPPEALVLPSQLEDNLVRLTILLVKQQQMKGKIIIIIMKHLFHHSCFLQSSMVLDFCSSKIYT